MANISGLQILRLEVSNAARYRDIRLEALRQNPEAFGSTFERENAQPLSWFEAAVGRSDIFGAFLDGKLAGTAGYAAQEGSKRAHKALLWGRYVRSAVRSAGLGRSLVAAVLSHARGRVKMVQLTVVSENEGDRAMNPC